MSYAEVREFAYNGASVLHPDSLLPVSRAGIPTRVLNPFDPTAASTLISSSVKGRTGTIVGVASRSNFSVISVTLSSMNPQIGLARTLLEIIEKANVSLEHMPGSLDSLSFIIDGKYREKLPGIVDAMQKRYADAYITIKHGMSMIAIVGEGMVHALGTLAKITKSLADAGINISMANQGASEMVILLGVDDCDADDAVRAIYRDCIAPADVPWKYLERQVGT